MTLAGSRIGFTLAALLLPWTSGSVLAAPACSYDTDGDGRPDVVAPDRDGDGFCDFPNRTTRLRGTLVFRAGERVKFRGNPTIQADAILLEPGALVEGDRRTLKSLRIVAVNGVLQSLGTIAIAARKDVSLSSLAGSIALEGPTTISAGDELLLDASGGGIGLAPPADAPGGAFMLLATRVDILAQSGVGDVLLSGARVGGRRVTIDAVAHGSDIGPLAASKHLDINGGSLVTTDPDRTGLQGAAGDILMSAGGRIDVAAASQLDSGDDLKIATAGSAEDVCLEAGALLQARHRGGKAGVIDLSGVGGEVEDDGTVVEDGRVTAPGAAGTCGPTPCDAVSGPVPAVRTAREVPSPQPAAQAGSPEAEFLKWHTAVRKNASPKPDPALKVEWDAQLETSAKYWAHVLVTRKAKEAGGRAEIACDCQEDPNNPNTEDKKSPHSFHRGLVDRGAKDAALANLRDSLKGPVLQTAKGELLNDQGKVVDPKDVTTRQGKEIGGGFHLIEPDGYVNVGENIFRATEDLKVADAAKRAMCGKGDCTATPDTETGWAADERTAFKYFDRAKGQSGCPGRKDRCGHYTQVVWAESMKIGCAVDKCPKDTKQWTTVVVCQYRAAGNVPEYSGKKKDDKVEVVSTLRVPYPTKEAPPKEEKKKKK